MRHRIALRIAHTVIDQTSCALQSRNPVDHRTKTVGCVLTGASRVPLLRVEFLAESATQPRLHNRAQTTARRVGPYTNKSTANSTTHATDGGQSRMFLQAAVGVSPRGPDKWRIIVDRSQLNVRVVVAGRYLSAD